MRRNLKTSALHLCPKERSFTAHLIKWIFSSFTFLFFTTFLQAKPMVYDCFLFLNEYEILNIRLHEMNDVVDKFVLVESVETFRGNPKPLNYLENSHLFEKFSDKIIHVVVEHFDADNPWKREAFQRNQIMRGLSSCRREDIILISDVDEIVEHTGVLDICSALQNKRGKVVGVEHRFHSNFLNSVPESPWRGTVACTFQNLEIYTPQRLREAKDGVPIFAKGWHFTWQGGLENDLYKLGAYSHAESDTFEVREEKRRLAKIRHLCPVIEIDDTFPKYVQENQEYFESIGFIRQPSS